MTLLTIRIEGGLLSPDFLETIHDQPGQKPADFGLDARRSLVDEVTAVWSDVRAYWEAFERRRARAKDGESLTTATREAWIIPLLEALGYRLTFQRRAAEADGRSYAISHRATGVGSSEVVSREIASREIASREIASREVGSREIASREIASREVGSRPAPPTSLLPTAYSLLPDSGPPVHIVAFDQKLGERSPSGRSTMAPHALVQDYLNRSDDTWGIVTNGATLRLLRDSVYFSRPSYVEFDLQGMLEGERLDEFILFYRLAHRTRLAAAGEDGSRCLLESYHQAAIEQGGRIRDGLRKAVEGAILTLANGFLSHPKNGELRRAIAGNELSASAYYQQLLYLIYRLLFLMVAEERNLLASSEMASSEMASSEVASSEVASSEVASRATHYSLSHYSLSHYSLSHYSLSHYSLYYSITRLRRLAETPLSGPQRFDDLYLGLCTLFQVLRDETQAPALGVPALNGELFDVGRTRHLEAAYLNNRDLLSAIRQLSYFTPEKEQVRRRVNYAALDVEELGSVYESLLDEHPVIEGVASGEVGSREVGSREVGSREVGSREVASRATHYSLSRYSLLPRFSFVQGTERKTTGSYYTARELVKETLDSALDPVIREIVSGEIASREVGSRTKSIHSSLATRYSPEGKVTDGEKTDPVLPRSRGVAEGDGSRRSVLQADEELSAGRIIRHDLTDSESRGVGAGEHRGGAWPGASQRIRSVPADRSGISEGSGDTSDPGGSRPADDRSRDSTNLRTVRPVGSSASRVDSLLTAGSGEVASGEVANGEVASGEVANGEMASGEVASGEMASGEVANGEVASGEVASGEMASSTTHYLATHDLATHYLATHDLATPYSPSPYSLLTTSLLSIRVCDPACGSGHFLLAAARRIGRALAQVATGEDEPSPEAVRHWTREAIIHCIYGVDKNPLAVDLCKVALWIEGHAPGKPLTFLDAHIKCGDSLVGVFDLEVLDEGIPDEAFDPVTGDDKPTARELKRRNKQERAGQLGLALSSRQAALDEAVRAWQAQLDSPEDTPAQVRRKQAAYAKLQQQENAQRTACDLWTAAFFTPLTTENIAAGAIPTTATLQNYRRQPAAADPRLVAHARALAVRNQFFHWPLEFPHVFREVGSREVGSREVEAPLATRHSPFARSGFTVMLGNPPWERIKLQEQEFFAARDLEIAEAPNKAARGRLIERLPKINPTLAQEFADAKQAAEATSRFVRQSGRFPLTAVGDVNSYALFAELVRGLLASLGRAGIIVPTGIATDDTTKDFFGDLAAKRSLASFYDFENREAIFPGVHRSQKFSLLTISARPVEQSQFVFYATRVEHLTDPQRRFTLAPDEIALFNPNTRTMPIFRTRADADLTTTVYRRTPVLANERTGVDPWGVSFLRMLDMSNDSGLFEDHPLRGYLPLYESKMIWHFDHRFGSYEGVADRNSTHLPTPTPDQYADPTYTITPWYWVPPDEVAERLGNWKREWLLGFRDITNATNERTAIFSLLPRVGVGNNAPLMLLNIGTTPLVACFVANLNSLACDYVTRQKIAGTHMNFFFVKQLPVLPPQAYSQVDIAFIVPRVLELVYTAWDMAPFAADLWREWRDGELANGEIMKGATDDSLLTTHHSLLAQWEVNRSATGGHPWNPPAWANLPPTPDSPFATPYCPLPPFKWDENRRALLRAELDAYYARLYGLTRDELRYILDPKDVYGPDFPGETFRVLKEKEERACGEYRTRRLVLEAWDRLQAELGPVVVRNYREEGTASSVVGSGEVRSAPARSARRVAEARAAYEAGRQPALLNEAPAPDSLLPTPPLPAPPQGSRYERLGRLLELGKQRTAAAIGELVAALGDEDENLRWLAAMSLQGIGGETVVATLRAFMAQAPSAAAQAEAERVLGKLEDRQV